MVWGGAGQVKPRKYPSDWYEVNEFIKSKVQKAKSQKSRKPESQKIKSQKCNEKILFLPWHLYMSFKWIGSIVANPAPKFFECPVIYGQNMEFGGIFGHSVGKDEKRAERWVFSVGRTNLLQENKINIGYVLLAKEVNWKNYLWLGNHPNLKFVKETKNLILYKVHPVR